MTQEGGTCRERVKGEDTTHIDLQVVKRKKKLMT